MTVRTHSASGNSEQPGTSFAEGKKTYFGPFTITIQLQYYILFVKVLL